MNAAELDNAMLFGSDREGKEDCMQELGRFGLGLKSASLSQCREFTVASKKFGRIHAMSFDLDVVEAENKLLLKQLTKEEIAALEEWDVDGKYKDVIENIKADLEALKANEDSTASDVYALLARIDLIRNCEHICHSNNWFLKVLWSIAKFFCWLFKIVPVCKCGLAHY